MKFHIPWFLPMLSLTAWLQTTHLHADSPIKIDFSAEGLSSIRTAGVEHLANGLPFIQRVTDAENKVIQSKLITSNFDAGSKILTNTYPWGTLSVTYRELEAGLGMKVEIKNQSEGALTSVVFSPVILKELGEGRVPQPTHCFEEPTFTFFEGSGGTVVLGTEDRKDPLLLQTTRDQKNSTVAFRVGIGGGKLVGDNVLMSQTVAPGESAQIHLMLRVGPAGTSAMALAGDFLEDFREANPMRLHWPDRRPILRAFFGGGVTIPEAMENMKNPAAVQPPVPDGAFRENMLRKVRGLIEAAKVADAQAMILWDLEGGTFPHATTYIGDPRLIRLLNPQMDLVADEMFQMLTEAGLRTGITLRPSRVIFDPEKNAVRHSYADAKDPFEELAGKVEYAKNRWGCTVFYVDTNFFWRPYGPEKKWQAAPINGEVWRRLLERFPDTLFIPEFANTADYASTVGYGEADMGNYGVSEVVRALYPEAFRVIVIEDADPSEQFDRFIDTLRNKNSLMTFGQGTGNLNTQMIPRMREWLDLEDSPVPPAVAGAEGGSLVSLLSSSDPATAFHAARKLAQTPVPAAAAQFVALAGSEGTPWPLRRAAVLALATTPDVSAIPILFSLLENRETGLYGDAARSLAAQDVSVEKLAVEKIRELAAKSGMRRGFDRIGSVLVLRNASSSAPELQEIYSAINEKDTNAQRELLELVGQLRNPASEAFLLTLLQDPKVGPAAGAALVRIGTGSGVEAVKAAQKAAQASGNKELAGAYGRALQAK